MKPSFAQNRYITCGTNGIHGKKVTFAVEVQKHKNRIVIPKKKDDELDLKPGDYLKITDEKITAEE